MTRMFIAVVEGRTKALPCLPECVYWYSHRQLRNSNESKGCSASAAVVPPVLDWCYYFGWLVVGRQSGLSGVLWVEVYWLRYRGGWGRGKAGRTIRQISTCESPGLNRIRNRAESIFLLGQRLSSASAPLYSAELDSSIIFHRIDFSGELPGLMARPNSKAL